MQVARGHYTDIHGGVVPWPRTLPCDLGQTKHGLILSLRGTINIGHLGVRTGLALTVFGRFLPEGKARYWQFVDKDSSSPRWI